MSDRYTFNHYLKNKNGSTFAVDADLDNMNMTLGIEELPDILVSVKELPDISVRVKELPRIEFSDFNIRLKELPRIELDANTNSTVNLAITEIPEVRTQLPSHYNLCFSLLGVEIMSLSLCGESQVITEKYKPRRMEEICR